MTRRCLLKKLEAVERKYLASLPEIPPPVSIVLADAMTLEELQILSTLRRENRDPATDEEWAAWGVLIPALNEQALDYGFSSFANLKEWLKEARAEQERTIPSPILRTRGIPLPPRVPRPAIPSSAAGAEADDPDEAGSATVAPNKP